MSNRDDFSQKVKAAIAARAGYHCSFTGCGRTTVGPSEESPDAFSNTGKAAHISGAAPGKGSRRYRPDMTAEERANIENAIWLCSIHADYIDRDEVTYTVENLQAMKRAHEAAQAIAQRDGTNPDLGTDLLGIGPDVVCTGDLGNVSAGSWTLRLRHFIIGDIHKVVALIAGFDVLEVQDRYVLSNDLGDGRLFSGPPVLTKEVDGYSLVCPIEPVFPRIDAQNLGSDFALDPDTNDLFVRNGNIARVSGVDYLPQKIQSSLSVQRGEDVFHPDFGMRFFEYFEEFKGSHLLDWLFKLDVVRQAAIPFTDDVLKREYTPLQCVTRVIDVALLSETPTQNRLPVRVNLEVQGIGPWQRELSIYMPTKEQMTERAKLIAERHF